MRASALPPELESHADKVTSGNQWVLRGGSCIIAPNGSYVVPPVFELTTLLHAELDLSEVRREQMALDVAGHYNRPDSFEFRINKQARV